MSNKGYVRLVTWLQWKVMTINHTLIRQYKLAYDSHQQRTAEQGLNEVAECCLYELNVYEQWSLVARGPCFFHILTWWGQLLSAATTMSSCSLLAGNNKCSNWILDNIYKNLLRCHRVTKTRDLSIVLFYSLSLPPLALRNNRIFDVNSVIKLAKATSLIGTL